MKKLTIAFTLAMPGVGSWNGRWSGEGKLFCELRKVSPQQAAHLDRRVYHYAWEDGWRASVACRYIPTSSEAGKLRRASRGFCGYEWMVDSILERDCIKASHELEVAP